MVSRCVCGHADASEGHSTTPDGKRAGREKRQKQPTIRADLAASGSIPEAEVPKSTVPAHKASWLYHLPNRPTAVEYIVCVVMAQDVVLYVSIDRSLGCFALMSQKHGDVSLSWLQLLLVNVWHTSTACPELDTAPAV